MRTSNSSGRFHRRSLKTSHMNSSSTRLNRLHRQEAPQLTRTSIIQKRLSRTSERQCPDSGCLRLQHRRAAESESWKFLRFVLILTPRAGSRASSLPISVRKWQKYAACLRAPVDVVWPKMRTHYEIDTLAFRSSMALGLLHFR